MIRTSKVPGRVLAWVALLVALGASVAANIAYARPDLGPRLSAGVAPVLVVLAAAMLERVPLASARWWQRWLSGLGLAVVAGTAFVVSYLHQYALVIEYGNPKLTAALLPISIDGLIVMASVCLAVIAERRRELATRVATFRPPAGESAKVPHGAGTPAEEMTVPLSFPVTDIASDSPTRREQPKRQRKQPTTAERVARLRDRDPDLSASVIAKRVGVTERTVSRHLRDLAVADNEVPPASVNGTPVPDLVTTA